MWNDRQAFAILFLLRHRGIDCEPSVQPQTKAHHSGNRQNQRVGIAERGSRYTVLVFDDAVFQAYSQFLLKYNIKGRLKTLIQRFQTAF